MSIRLGSADGMHAGPSPAVLQEEVKEGTAASMQTGW